MGGGYPVPAGAGLTSNRAELVGKDGQILATYDKIHLFDVDLPDGNTYQESATVQPGASLPPVVDVPGSAASASRFATTFASRSSTGTWPLRVRICSLFFAFTAFTGKDHWNVLLQARAIENTAYVVAPAQTGQHGPRRQTLGHALVLIPGAPSSPTPAPPWVKRLLY